MSDTTARSWLRRLLAVAAVLALAVVVLGAYVRLKGAGLGCPDWPGCYGQLVGVPDATADGTVIASDLAWIEVSHRYLAAGLGLLILAACVLAWIGKVPYVERAIATTLLCLICVQGLLGALTVTKLLKPIIVTSHLLGGLAILAVLAAYAVRALTLPGFRPAASRRPNVLLAITATLLIGQVALGGWVSANYAGLACGINPVICADSWLPPTDTSAFAFDRELARDINGVALTQQALATVQWAHRLGAVLVTLAVVATVMSLRRHGRAGQAGALLACLILQLLLGMYIVLTRLPLLPSLAHNAGAALLCATFAAIVATRRTQE